MDDPARIALIGDHPGELIGDTQPALRLGQQHDAAVGTDPPAVKGGGNLLAVHDWKAERQKVIVGHGGRGVLDPKGFSNRILRRIKSLLYIRHPKSAPRHEYDGLKGWISIIP